MWYDSFAGWKYSQFICHIRWPMVKELVAHYNNPRWTLSMLRNWIHCKTTTPPSTNMTDVHTLKITVNSMKLHCFHIQKCVVFGGMLISYTTHIKEDSNKERAHGNGKCSLVAISIQRYSEVGLREAHPLFAMLFVFTVSWQCQNN